ncbi:MAG: right-handed parallel beta-helix repeat-containing protein [Opitutaceae bacterium]
MSRYRWVRGVRVWFLVAACLLGAPLQAAVELWVSTDGDDASRGSENSPLATLGAAVRRARELRRLKSPDLLGGVRITLKSGTYRLSEPVRLRPEDSGTSESPLLIVGAGSIPVCLTGGARVMGWRRTDDGMPGLPWAARGQVWEADVPEHAGRAIEFRQLWVNGRKAVRARTPDGDRMERLAGWDRATGVMHLPARVALPKDISGVELVVLQAWEIAVLRIREARREGADVQVRFHEPENRIQIEHPWPQPVMDGKNGPAPFFLTGSIEFLDTPGEWHLDRSARKLFYWPRAGEVLTEAEVTVPILESLLEITGTIDQPVEQVTFRNLEFATTTWLRPSLAGHVPLQAGFFLLEAYGLAPKGTADWHGLDNQAWTGRPPAAVEVNGARRLRFEACHFVHTAANALDLRQAVHDSEVEGCSFTDIGINAVVLGAFGDAGRENHFPYAPGDEREACSHLRVANSLFHDCANEDWGGVPVLAGFVRDTTIEHNEIGNSSYTGISLGWGWTRTANVMRRNRIHANHIHHVALRTADCAGIYTLSAQPDTVVSENAVHSLVMSPYVHDPEHWFYLYADEGTSFVTFRDNWCPEPRFLQNANGPGNRWDNNGPQVDAAVRARAGLEPAYRHLLRRLPPGTGYPVETQSEAGPRN